MAILVWFRENFFNGSQLSKLLSSFFTVTPRTSSVLVSSRSPDPVEFSLWIVIFFGWCWKRIIVGYKGQYHDWWCPSALYQQNKNKFFITFLWSMGYCLPQGRMSITFTILVPNIDSKSIRILKFRKWIHRKVSCTPLQSIGLFHGGGALF